MPDAERRRVPVRRVVELRRADMLEEKARRVANLGMLLQERRKNRIRRQVGIVPQKRGIGPQDPADGRRELLEELFEACARFSGVLALVDEDLGRLLSCVWLLDRRSLLPCRRLNRARLGRGQGRDQTPPGRGSRRRNASEFGRKSWVSRLLTHLLRRGRGGLTGPAVRQESGIRDQPLTRVHPGLTGSSRIPMPTQSNSGVSSSRFGAGLRGGNPRGRRARCGDSPRVPRAMPGTMSVLWLTRTRSAMSTLGMSAS